MNNDWEDVNGDWEDVGTEIKKPSPIDLFKKAVKSVTPQDIITGTAPYKAWRGLGEGISEYGVPAMQKVPIIKDIPFGARLTGDPNAVVDLMTTFASPTKALAKESAVSALPKTVKNIMQPVKFAQKIRGEFYKVKKSAVDKFGSQIDELSKANPSKSISIRNIVDDINSNIDNLSSEAKSIFRKTPKLNKMIDNPELANNISLRDAQDIINYINTKVPSKIKSSNIDILDTLSDLRASQLDAFPEMQATREAYRSIAEPYKNIQNQLKFNKLLKAIENKFGGEEGLEAVKKLLPKSVVNEINKYRTAVKSGKAIKTAIPWLLGGGIGFGVGRGLMKGIE